MAVCGAAGDGCGAAATGTARTIEAQAPMAAARPQGIRFMSLSVEEVTSVRTPADGLPEANGHALYGSWRTAAWCAGECAAGPGSGKS
ncbi:hypothetical protein San01_24390 [Streptomyces angustmyceticus]|uniref:Uncharacterized protein n=1 Tax=Streptomyces angustmyceticus TaxID=285578 RepID=A0A5J4LCM2_9ACTN|nr:hypothetical protein San01_24390 [Streptomyces angustmyceticus]